MKTFKTQKMNFQTALIVGMFLLFSATAVAQKSNFTGSWTWNETKSPAPENGFRMGASKIIATQTDLNLSIDRTYKGRDGEDVVAKETYTLDGKECENLFFQSMKRKSTATWSTDGKTLTISSVTFFERDGETMEMKSSEVWKMSDAGELVMDVIFNSPNGEMKSSMIYDKAK